MSVVARLVRGKHLIDYHRVNRVTATTDKGITSFSILEFYLSEDIHPSRTREKVPVNVAEPPSSLGGLARPIGGFCRLS